MAMKLDHDDLNRLIEKISTSDIQEFCLEGEDFKLEIKRNLNDRSKFTDDLVSNNPHTIPNASIIPPPPKSPTKFRGGTGPLS